MQRNSRGGLNGRSWIFYINVLCSLQTRPTIRPANQTQLTTPPRPRMVMVSPLCSRAAQGAQHDRCRGRASPPAAGHHPKPRGRRHVLRDPHDAVQGTRERRPPQGLQGRKRKRELKCVYLCVLRSLGFWTLSNGNPGTGSEVVLGIPWAQAA